MNHNHIAPLKNVTLFTETLERVQTRPSHLPGIALFYGFAGYGKTFSATYGANKHQAFYVEVGYSWSQTFFCDAILNEIGIQVKGTIPAKINKIIEHLASEDRPLIIDEADHIVNKKYVDIIREIHDKSGVPVILIGEELLPAKIQEWERFHSRILDFVAAEPVSLQDIVYLARLYCPDVEIQQDLLEHLHKLSRGGVRRVAVNLEQIAEIARTSGANVIGKKNIPDEKLFTGLTPQRRRAA